MSQHQIPWTEEETARLMRIYRQESAAGYRQTSWVNIVRRMPGRTRAQCQGKIRYQLHGSRSPHIGKAVRHDNTPRVRAVPTDVIADAQARSFLSHRTLTAAIFGDPLPGRSALENPEDKTPKITLARIGAAQ